MIRILDSLEREYIRYQVNALGIEQAGRQILSDMMFTYDVCWTEEGVFIPRDEVEGEVYSYMLMQESDYSQRLLYRHMAEEFGVSKVMCPALCRLLNTYGKEEAARRNLLDLIQFYGIPLREEAGE